jgi:predicted DNA-binding protein
MVLKELTNMVPKMTRKIKPSAKTTERSKYLSCNISRTKAPLSLKVKVHLPSLAEIADF